MDTKTIVMNKLGLSKLGKKARFRDIDGGKDVHLNVGDDVAMEVKRMSGGTDFVIGCYDSKEKRYRVAYDPNMRAGRIKEVVAIYANS